jgi:hypothetical protein
VPRIPLAKKRTETLPTEIPKSRFRNTERNGTIEVLANVETPMLAMKYQKCRELGRPDKYRLFFWL